MLGKALVGSPKLHQPKDKDRPPMMPQHSVMPSVVTVANDIARKQPHEIPQVKIFVGEDAFQGNCFPSVTVIPQGDAKRYKYAVPSRRERE